MSYFGRNALIFTAFGVLAGCSTRTSVQQDPGRPLADSLAAVDRSVATQAQLRTHLDLELERRRRQWFHLEGQSTQELEASRREVVEHLARVLEKRPSVAPIISAAEARVRNDTARAARWKRPATVVLLSMAGPALGGESGVAVYMKAGFWPEAVIIVPAETSAEHLATAFGVLNRMWHEFRASDTAWSTGALLKVPVPVTAARRALTDAERSSYARYLGAFPNGVEVHVPGVGKGRSIEVVMPDWPVRR